MTPMLLLLLTILSFCTVSAWNVNGGRLRTWISKGHFPSLEAKTRRIAASLLLPALLIGGSPDISFAKGGPEGSKTSRKFENCVSQCVFDETKPPPVGSGVDRLEAVDQKTAIRVCRKKCAKTKAQEMLGNPKDKAAMGQANKGEDTTE